VAARIFQHLLQEIASLGELPALVQTDIAFSTEISANSTLFGEITSTL